MFIVEQVFRFSQAEEGATAVEYAIMLALVLVALISSITAVGNSTSGVWSNDSNKISAALSGS